MQITYFTYLVPEVSNQQDLEQSRLTVHILSQLEAHIATYISIHVGPVLMGPEPSEKEIFVVKLLSAFDDLPP